MGELLDESSILRGASQGWDGERMATLHDTTIEHPPSAKVIDSEEISRQARPGSSARGPEQPGIVSGGRKQREVLHVLLRLPTSPALNCSP